MIGKNCLQKILATPSVGERRSKSKVWEGKKMSRWIQAEIQRQDVNLFFKKKIAEVGGGGQTLDFLVFIYFLATCSAFDHSAIAPPLDFILFVKKSIVLLLVKEPFKSTLNRAMEKTQQHPVGFEPTTYWSQGAHSTVIDLIKKDLGIFCVHGTIFHMKRIFWRWKWILNR